MIDELKELVYTLACTYEMWVLVTDDEGLQTNEQTAFTYPDIITALMALGTANLLNDYPNNIAYCLACPLEMEE